MRKSEKESLANAKRQLRTQKRQLKAEQKQRAKVLQQQKKNSARLNAKTAKKIKQQQAPKTAADCLQWQAMYENGICEIEPGLYSMTLRFSDVNYQISHRE